MNMSGVGGVAGWDAIRKASQPGDHNLASMVGSSFLYLPLLYDVAIVERVTARDISPTFAV